MALYTILFGLSLCLIALVLAVIKKMFFQWKEEHKNEITASIEVDTARAAVNMIIYMDKCVVRRRTYAGYVSVFDVITKSDISLDKNENSIEGQIVEKEDYAMEK